MNEKNLTLKGVSAVGGGEGIGLRGSVCNYLGSRPATSVHMFFIEIPYPLRLLTSSRKQIYAS